MFRDRSTFVYLALFLGFVCYLTFIDKKIPGTREREQAEAELYKFDQDEVNSLEIRNVHGSFSFEKKNDHWEITSPVNTLADGPTILEILSQIAEAKPQRTIPIDAADKSTEGNLKEWGLSPAAERVVIHLKDRSLELLIGRKIAINDSVYARTSERRNAPVRIIPSLVKTALQKTLSDFRSRNVFDFNPDQARRIATRVANTATTPAQDCEADFKDENWTLQKPVVARASKTEVMALLNKILGLRVNDFVTDDPGNLAQYGLTAPTATLSVSLAGDEEGVLQVGATVPGKTGEVYAQRLKSNSVFTLTQSTLNEILAGLSSVRDRHVLPFDPGKATGVAFDFAGKKVDLRRQDNLWNLTGEAGGLADIGKVSDLLSRLSQLETTPVLKDSAPDLKPYGLDKPAGKIVVTSPELKTPLTLALGKVENHLLYVRNSSEPFVYTLPETALDFLAAAVSYRDNRAIDLILSKVRTLTITPQGKTPLVLSRSPGATWSADNTKGGMVDSSKVETQASLLCQLQAKGWLGPPSPAYALDKPVLTFALHTDDGKTTVLRIGAALPDGTHAAQVEGSKIAFALSDSDYGFLNASSLQLIPDLKGTTNAPAATPPAGAKKSAGSSGK